LLDILGAIEEIEEYTCLSHDEYVRNKLIQGWMILQLRRIGEAAAHLSESVRREFPHIPWQDIVGMRNLLIHEYLGISLTRVWVTVVTDVPVLKECVSRVLDSLNEP
jgi:uncharacterized protein with HEPN domain